MLKIKGWKGKFKISPVSIVAHNQNKEFPTGNEIYNKDKKLGSVEERTLLETAFGRQKANKEDLASFIVSNDKYYNKYWIAD